MKWWEHVIFWAVGGAIIGGITLLLEHTFG